MNLYKKRGFFFLMEIKRGQIWYTSFNDAIGSEQSVGRPAVIVSDEKGGAKPVVNIVWLTTSLNTKTNAVHALVTSTKRRAHALCEQVTTVDKSRLKEFLCDAFPEEMERIDAGLRTALALTSENTDIDDITAEYEEKLEAAEEAWYSWKTEADTYKRLYEKALDKLVDVVMHTPKPVEKPEPVQKQEPKPESEPKPQPKPKKKAEIVLPAEENSDKVNINTAQRKELLEVGINHTYAARIIKYRTEHGRFESIDDLWLGDVVGKIWFETWKNKLVV